MNLEVRRWRRRWDARDGRRRGDAGRESNDAGDEADGEGRAVSALEVWLEQGDRTLNFSTATKGTQVVTQEDA